ncbi:MAG TPA: thioredoxin domain-containing protein [Candidatus Acidoferrales bacterium]|nr:thioredoxin domain-containing protein [Candidatus Acidoferrales bacterium]
MTDAATTRSNHLAGEKSPYLLQHVHNPVDWHPWGDEAFARARAEDKPVFLSIGYSTCHWCHVMERESFEHPQVAALLNEHFVPVKVDREERPDVDRLYMTAAQAMHVGGGWPLNLFLTPELEPFFGGTYFPPETRGDRPGLLDLLPRVVAAWREKHDEIVVEGARLLELLDTLADPGDEAPTPAKLAQECAQALARSYDSAVGGFGTAPKFPSPGNLAFLLRWWSGGPNERNAGLTMTLRQLDAMRAGGIHDHLGGGFHRYSTDREWRVPHFEKMLYDQALIADVYLDAFLATGHDAYARTARDVFAYVERDLVAPGGAFCSAEDADSEGEEGRFYVWTAAELQSVLGEDAALAAHHWGVTPQGNFEHGASVLREAHPLAATARVFGLSEADAATRIERARATLLARRSQRPRPGRDDKVLAGWNGLMIAALARGARVLGEARWHEAASRAATFVWRELRDPATGALMRRWRDGEAAGEGQLDDHANLARATLELFAATHDPLWLERAAALTSAQIERFWDEEHGAFFESPAADPHLKVRMKDAHDGAEPAANSVAASNLVRLSALLERHEWRTRAQRLLDYFARRIAGAAWAMPQMLVAMEHAARSRRHVVVAGEDGEDRRALLAVANRGFRPFDEWVVVDGGSRAALARLAPFTASLPPRNGRACAYVCVDGACRLPMTEPAALEAELNPAAPRAATEPA